MYSVVKDLIFGMETIKDRWHLKNFCCGSFVSMFDIVSRVVIVFVAV
jgi:hypothetical protein